MSCARCPPSGRPARLSFPTQAERTLPNGLTVIAVRRPAVPLVEVRLRVPFGGGAPGPLRPAVAHPLLRHRRDANVDIAAELQKVGGGLSAGVDPDRLLISGNGLVSGLDRILEILAEVLVGATYPGDEVATERERLADRIQVALSQPSHLARVALLKRIYGGHPYAVQTPEPERGEGGRSPDLRALHAERLHPNGAVLVLVGDLEPEAALDTAERALGGWDGGGVRVELPPSRRCGRGRCCWSTGRARCSRRCGWRCRRSAVPTRTTPRCNWPT